MRVLGYVRLSRETEATTSPERQREIIENWVKIHDYQLIDIAEDLGVSGSIHPWVRPGLRPWLADWHSNYDMIVGSRVDRISRRLFHFAELTSWATDNGKAIASATEPINTSDKFGRMIAQILAMFAEFEREAIRERNLGSQAKAREEGRYHGGIPPFGYKAEKHPSGKGYVLVPDDKAISVLEEIIQWCRDKESMNSICSHLNDSGVPTPNDFYRLTKGKKPKGHRWAPTSLRDIIGSKALLGVTVTKTDEIVYGDDGLPIQRAEPVVARQDWDYLQAYLARVSREPQRTRSTSPLLGVAFCLKCGQPLYRTVVESRVYWRCKTKVQPGADCGAVSFRADDLAEVAGKCLLEHVGDLEVLEEVFIPGESHSEALRDATAAWDDLQEKSAGKPPAVQALYVKKIAAVEERIAALSALPESNSRTELKPTGHTYRQVWDQADDQGRRKLLLSAGVRMEAAAAEGDWVPVGRFERSDRYDEAVLLGQHGEFHYAYWLPKDLVVRATRQTAK